MSKHTRQCGPNLKNNCEFLQQVWSWNKTFAKNPRSQALLRTHERLDLAEFGRCATLACTHIRDCVWVRSRVHKHPRSVHLTARCRHVQRGHFSNLRTHMEAATALELFSVHRSHVWVAFELEQPAHAVRMVTLCGDVQRDTAILPTRRTHSKRAAVCTAYRVPDSKVSACLDQKLRHA